MPLTTYTLNALTVSPAIIDRLVSKLPADALDARPDPDRFTVREVVCHLADWEPIFLERLLGAVNNELYTTVSIDESELAIKHDYAHQDLDAAMTRLKHGRESYVAFLQTLDDDALGHRLRHHAFGEISVVDLVSFVVGHDVYHIDQISALL